MHHAHPYYARYVFLNVRAGLPVESAMRKTREPRVCTLQRRGYFRFHSHGSHANTSCGCAIGRRNTQRTEWQEDIATKTVAKGARFKGEAGKVDVAKRN